MDLVFVQNLVVLFLNLLLEVQSVLTFFCCEFPFIL